MMRGEWLTHCLVLLERKLVFSVVDRSSIYVDVLVLAVVVSCAPDYDKGKSKVNSVSVSEI